MKFLFEEEQAKCEAGQLYNTKTPERERLHVACMELCFAYNATSPSDMKQREEILRKLFGKLGAEPYVEPTIFFGFGTNVEAGDRLFINNDCVFVDPGKIILGDDVLIGPQCGFYLPFILWTRNCAERAMRWQNRSGWETMSGSAVMRPFCRGLPSETTPSSELVVW